MGTNWLYGYEAVEIFTDTSLIYQWMCECNIYTLATTELTCYIIMVVPAVQLESGDYLYRFFEVRILVPLQNTCESLSL